jgi:hypothetical protein
MPEFVWKGPDPYFLAIRQYEKPVYDYSVELGRADMLRHTETTVIDLNEPGWLTTYAHLMRVPGAWMLCDKVKSDETGELYPVLFLLVQEGEQPYYTKKHIGILPFGEARAEEVVCYGIGKKRVDGQVDRMWIMPNGMVCPGEDVYEIGAKMVKGQL